jgi:hypothetical protein
VKPGGYGVGYWAVVVVIWVPAAMVLFGLVRDAVARRFTR